MSTDVRFDEDVDVLVVGSGGGGMVAALTAADAGFDVAVIEKSEYFGGSTVLSGGSIWVPNASVIVRAGVTASEESVVAYLSAISEGKVAIERIRSLVKHGPEMLALLERSSSHLQFEWRPDYPDYHPDAPGGSKIGRSVEAIPFDRRQLGELDSQMREPALRTPRGMWIRSNDLHTFLGLRRSWRGKLMFLRLIGRMVRGSITGARIVTRGEALIGRLRLALRDAGVPVRLRTALTRLLTDKDGRVIGAEIEQDGRVRRILARHGVILASGGFDHDLAMRKQHQPVLTGDWSMGARENTGDGIRAGQQERAGVALLDDAWWMPAIPWGNGKLGLLLFERQIPGQFVVNGDGRRYTNEAAPYTDFVHDMIAGHESGVTHIPSWLIIDERSWRTYMFAGHLPLPHLPGAPVLTGRKLPQSWVDSGSAKTARNWPELAAAIGVPADNLVETAQRFNQFARIGRDEDFHRGDSAYDNYYGDPRLPNPNLRELDDGPYYAFKMIPSDLGTKGGLLTDEHARVLTVDGGVIDGLYATGNTTAAVTGNGYSGPGGTIGPAMTFGYVAARHIADRNRFPLVADVAAR